MNARLHRAVDQVGRLPGLLQWRRRRFDKAFSTGHTAGCCRGCFASYAQAVAAAPTSLPLGFDHAAAAAMYRDRLNHVYPSDYPMMLWLQKAFADGARTVFDLGGHVGVAYYAYQQVLAFPSEVSWRVYDVPAVVEAGRREALERDPARRLSFTNHFETAAEADVLFTSGCLQYLEPTLADLIASLPRRPRWVLVNLLPLHEQSAYWTVQSIGTAFCPYRIQRSHTFFGDLAQLGYRVLDNWENLEKECWIAFDAEHSLDRYHGAALKLE